LSDNLVDRSELKVSVVIPTYTFDRFQDTVDAVDSLLKQKYSNKEIIVVVDRNRFLYLRFIQKLSRQVHVYFSSKCGASSARNLGVKKSSGDIIAFIDDDIVVGENWLSNIMVQYQDPTVLSVGGKIQPLWNNSTQSSFPKELYWIIGCTFNEEVGKACEVRNNFAGNMSFRRSVFNFLSFSEACQKIDGANVSSENNSFFRKYLESDDAEFYIRVHAKIKNSRTLYDPNVLAFHRIYPYRTSIGFILDRAFTQGISKAYLARLYPNTYYKSTLSKENQYVFSTFFKWVPNRVKKILKGEDIMVNLKSIALIFTVFALVFGGYIFDSTFRCSDR
jgi:glycosyltransferase involved in cell wall biosynthesis